MEDEEVFYDSCDGGTDITPAEAAKDLCRNPYAKNAGNVTYSRASSFIPVNRLILYS
jgi:hypothetical protein